MNRLFLAIAAAFALWTTGLGAQNGPAAPDGQKPNRFAAVDAKMARLDKIAGTYPPNVTGKKGLASASAAIRACIADLDGLKAKGAPAWETEWRIGDCFRMAHNLDVKGAWAQSEAHLKKAMGLKPDEPRPCVILGMLYVNSDMSLAPKAEALFRRAIEAAGAKPMPAAHQGLVFACYYQGKFAEADKEIDECLKTSPNNPKLLAIREVVRKRLGDAPAKSP